MSVRFPGRLRRWAGQRWPQSTWLGYQLRRLGARRPLPRTPLVVPRLLEQFARDRPRATVVQVGANDGIKLDPLRRHLFRRRWRAYLLEPVPYVYEALVANTRHNPRITPINLAIAPQEGTLPLHHLAPTDDPDVPDWYDALGSFDRDVLVGHADEVPGIEDRVVVTEVPTVTFDTLADRHGIERVDLLHVDTEGFDLQVLELVDLDRHRPDIVLFERRHLDAAQRARAHRLLVDAGFRLVDEGFDTLAVRLPDDPADEEPWHRTWRALVAEVAR